MNNELLHAKAMALNKLTAAVSSIGPSVAHTVIHREIVFGAIAYSIAALAILCMMHLFLRDISDSRAQTAPGDNHEASFAICLATIISIVVGIGLIATWSPIQAYFFPDAFLLDYMVGTR